MQAAAGAAAGAAAAASTSGSGLGGDLMQRLHLHAISEQVQKGLGSAADWLQRNRPSFGKFEGAIRVDVDMLKPTIDGVARRGGELWEQVRFEPATDPSACIREWAGKVSGAS